MDQKTRVGTFLPNIEYIKRMRGEIGVNSVLRELGKRGYRYDFMKMRKDDWVPGEVRKEFLHATMDALGWDEKKIKDMGANAPRVSPVIKYFFGMFLTPERLFKEKAPVMWREHWNAGNLRVGEYREGYATLIIEDFKLDPLYCRYLEGYFYGVAKLTNSKNVRIEENRCVYRGDKYHEYTVTWDP